MQKKYNILTFSDVPIPSYGRPYRGILFVDYAPHKRLGNVFVISPKSTKSFKNKEVTIISDQYFDESFDFSKEQYLLWKRFENWLFLLLKLVKFRLSNSKKVDFVRSGTTYLSLFLLITQRRDLVYFADICDFYSDLYGEFKMPLAKLLRPAIFFMEKIAQHRANLIFVDTSAQRDFLTKKMNVNGRQCVVIPNGILLENFPYHSKKDERVLESYGYTKNDKILFYGGDISKMDGIDLIIRFIETNRDIKALIIGKGKSKDLEDIRNEIRTKGLEKNIMLDSFKPYNELHRYISVADVCLAPFRLTNTSNTVESGKIITYLLGGKAVLATEADGVKSLYKDAVSYFKDGNYDDFSEKLLGLLSDKNDENAEMSRRRLGEKFDFKKIIEHEFFVIDQYFMDPKQDFSKYDYL